MKIYNEVITRFNDKTGKWETIYEDSFDYDGHITWQDLGFNPLLTLNYSTLFSVESFNLLTLFSSMFIHSGPLHLLMNMLILILMGLPFEERVGTRAFVKIYLISGVLGSLLTGLSAIHLGTNEADSYHIGASGAVFGIMGAFAYLYPRDEIPMLLGFNPPATKISSISIILLYFSQLNFSPVPPFEYFE